MHVHRRGWTSPGDPPLLKRYEGAGFRTRKQYRPTRSVHTLISIRSLAKGKVAAAHEPYSQKQQCAKHKLALCDLAEPLGFDSIWQPEHHFSGYEMTPNVLQFLTYMAGRTKTVRLGSMVVVLPWHNPLRVVEDVTLLDHYSAAAHRALQDVRGPHLWRGPLPGDDADFGEARRRADDLPLQELAGHTRHAQYFRAGQGRGWIPGV